VWGCHHRDRGPHFGTPKFGDSDPLVCLRLGMSCAMRRTGARPDVRLTDLIAARGQAPDSRGTLVFFDGGGPVVPFRRPASLPRRISLRRAHAEESAEADRAGPLPGRQGHEEVHDAEKEGQGALAEAEAKQAARAAGARVTLVVGKGPAPVAVSPRPKAATYCDGVRPA
jgi:hypothetical protein